MIDKLIRVYKKYDVADIRKHLLIYGDLGGTCANCNALDIKIDLSQCPQCGHVFQYISFRNVRTHIPKIQRFLEQRPEVLIIDYDDYKRNEGALKAKEFLK